MDTQRRARLAEIMLAMGDGDEAMVFALWREFAGEIGWQVRAIARRHGRTLFADEVNDLTGACCLALLDVAGGWRVDGGALPWTWAGRRLEAVVCAQIFGPLMPGDDKLEQRLEALNLAEESGQVLPHDGETDLCGVLGELAERHPELTTVVEILEGLPERNRNLFLEYRLQQELGDPSPANTVGEMYGLEPANVRQIVRRVRQRLLDAGVAVA